jgi:hypothetical protein
MAVVLLLCCVVLLLCCVVLLLCCCCCVVLLLLCCVVVVLCCCCVVVVVLCCACVNACVRECVRACVCILIEKGEQLLLLSRKSEYFQAVVQFLTGIILVWPIKSHKLVVFAHDIQEISIEVFTFRFPPFLYFGNRSYWYFNFYLKGN